MTNLFTDVARANAEIMHGWTTVTKAAAMAAMVVALRPKISVEIGVYAGKGLIALALAHKAIGFGKAIGIDPYTKEASQEGQLNEADREFWGKVDYDAMLGTCVNALRKYGCAEFVDIIVKRSSEVTPPAGMGLLRIDGNHGEEALKDTIAWAPKLERGGLIIVDDIGWTGGATTKAAQWLESGGWKKLYALDDGLVFQRL